MINKPVTTIKIIGLLFLGFLLGQIFCRFELTPYQIGIRSFDHQDKAWRNYYFVYRWDRKGGEYDFDKKGAVYIDLLYLKENIRFIPDGEIK